MNNNYVLDTMGLILWLEKRKLNSAIKTIFENAEEDNLKLFVPSIVFAEVGYLSEKGRIDVTLIDLKNYFDQYSSVVFEPLTQEIIYKSFEINDIPELHDRIIAGTAYFKNLQLITNDPVIINSKFVSTIW